MTLDGADEPLVSNALIWPGHRAADLETRANCFARNTPSWRLMERLGMRREVSTKTESLHRELGWLDGYGYALLADEWRAIQETAEQSASEERIDQHLP